MNISDAFESYGLSLVGLLAPNIFIVCRPKVPMLSEILVMKKGLMSYDMPALALERAVACTLPTR